MWRSASAARVGEAGTSVTVLSVFLKAPYVQTESHSGLPSNEGKCWQIPGVDRSGPAQTAAADSRLMEHSGHSAWPQETQAIHRHPFLSLHHFHSLSTPDDAGQAHSGPTKDALSFPTACADLVSVCSLSPTKPPWPGDLRTQQFQIFFSVIQFVCIWGWGGGGYYMRRNYKEKCIYVG